MSGALAATSGITDDFLHAAADNNELQAQDLASVPLREWGRVMAEHAPPANMEEFQNNLRNMIEGQHRMLDLRGVQETERQITRMGMGVNPTQPNHQLGTELELFQRGIEKAHGEWNGQNMNQADATAFAKGLDIGGIAEELKQDYSNAIDQIDDVYNAVPAPEAPAGPEAEQPAGTQASLSRGPVGMA